MNDFAYAKPKIEYMTLENGEQWQRVTYASAQDLILEACADPARPEGHFVCPENTIYSWIAAYKKGRFDWEDGSEPISLAWARNQALSEGTAAPNLSALSEILSSATFAARETALVKRRVKLKEQRAGRFCVTDMLNGSDRPFRRVRRQKVQRPTITLGINVGALSNVTPNQTIARGACLIVLADFLSRMGRSVAVHCYWGSDLTSSKGTTPDGNPLFGSSIGFTLKEHGSPLDISRLGLFCCNLTFARMTLLGAKARHTFGINPGLGRPKAGDLPKEIVPVDINIPADILSEEKAITWLKALISKGEF